MKRSLVCVMLLCAALAWGDDSEMLRRNVSKTPDLETEHAFLTMLELYVPAQTSGGELAIPISYVNVETTEVETRPSAKPLISFYQDGHVEAVEGVGSRSAE